MYLHGGGGGTKKNLNTEYIWNKDKTSYLYIRPLECDQPSAFPYDKLLFSWNFVVVVVVVVVVFVVVVVVLYKLTDKKSF